MSFPRVLNKLATGVDDGREEGTTSCVGPRDETFSEKSSVRLVPSISSSEQRGTQSFSSSKKERGNPVSLVYTSIRSICMAMTRPLDDVIKMRVISVFYWLTYSSVFGSFTVDTTRFSILCRPGMIHFLPYPIELDVHQGYDTHW